MSTATSSGWRTSTAATSVTGPTTGARTTGSTPWIIRYGLPRSAERHAGGPRSGLKWGSMVTARHRCPRHPARCRRARSGCSRAASTTTWACFDRKRPARCGPTATRSVRSAARRSRPGSPRGPRRPRASPRSRRRPPSRWMPDASARSGSRPAGVATRWRSTSRRTSRPRRCWAFQLTGATSYTGMPTDRIVRVFINSTATGPYRYDQTVSVIARVTADELPYWSPTTTPFLESTATDMFSLPKPDNAANRWSRTTGTAATSVAPAPRR